MAAATLGIDRGRTVTQEIEEGAPPSTLKIVLSLNLASGLILGVCVAIFGMGPGGMGAYLDELAGWTWSLGAIAAYTALVATYALLVELGLRRAVQAPIAGRWGPAGGVIAAAGLYGLFHVRFGVVGALYGVGVGVVTAAAYARARRVLPMMLWHLQWDLAAIGAALLLALAAPGAPREAINHAHKIEGVEAGRLQHRRGWGWIDASHYRGAQRRLCEVVTKIDENGAAAIFVEGSFKRSDGSIARIEERFCPAQAGPGATSGPGERLEVGAGVVLEMARLDERAQESAGFFSALQISAWNANDLPSVQRAMLDALVEEGFRGRCGELSGPTPAGFEVPGAEHDAAVNAARWRMEGRAEAGRLHRDLEALPEGATEADRALHARIPKGLRCEGGAEGR